jgi:hypothetical protein
MTEIKLNNLIRQINFEIIETIMDLYESILPLLIEINLAL